MAKVNLNLRNFTLPDKMQYATQIIKAMTGNANFKLPDPNLGDVQAAISSLQTTYTDANNLRQLSYAKTAEQNQQEKNVDMLLTALGNYVENASKGDEAIIKSAGIDTRAKAAPVGIPAMPLNLSAAEGDKNGQIKLKWKSVKGAKSYVVHRTTNVADDAQWMQEQVVTKAAAISTGLTSGTQYWYQVAAVGAAGQGAWSDPATKVAG